MRNNLKKIIKLFIPDIFFILKEKFFSLKKSQELFDGSNNIFRNSINKNSIYGEYGCGLSTLYVMKNYDIKVYSVDTSEIWVNEVKKKTLRENLYIEFINLGNISKVGWGRPESYIKKNKFMDYANSIWQHNLKPNVVLIDGRFRVLCFLVSLKMCDLNTKIIFDDYVTRKHYHVVEELVKPNLLDGRQALFEISDKKEINMNKLNFLIDKFNYVMD